MVLGSSRNKGGGGIGVFSFFRAVTSDCDSLVISLEVDDFVDRVTESRGQG